MKKDIGVLGKGKSDPYAIISVGSQEFKTQIIDNNVNPKWDYWCEVSFYFSIFIYRLFVSPLAFVENQNFQFYFSKFRIFWIN